MLRATHCCWQLWAREMTAAHLCGVGVVEADSHVPAVQLGDVVVQQSSLGVPDVQEARGLGREPGLHLPLLHVPEVDLEGPGICT